MARSYAAPGGTALALALLSVRLGSGIIFFVHGAQKVLDWWEGPGLAAMTSPQGMGTLGYFVALGEFLGGLALIVGLLSRFSAFWLIVIMLGAIQRVHGQHGFFLSASGYEYNLALIALLLPTLLAGPGRIALAALLPSKLRPWLE